MDEIDPLFHLVPPYGREHVLAGLCWCEPEPDPVEPAVVIHHAEH